MHIHITDTSLTTDSKDGVIISKDAIRGAFRTRCPTGLKSTTAPYLTRLMASSKYMHLWRRKDNETKGHRI